MPKGSKSRSSKSIVSHAESIGTKPKRRKLNTTQRHKLKAEAVRVFAKRIGRQAQKGIEPNERWYSRDTERIVNQMDPNEFDELLNGDD